MASNQAVAGLKCSRNSNKDKNVEGLSDVILFIPPFFSTELAVTAGTSPPGFKPPYYLDNLNLCT
jgi:hypothetical protein